VFFDSKYALYDAIFARGWGALGTVMEPIMDRVDSDVRAYLLRNAEAFVRWSVEHPAYSQLMFWRPVPGYEPSPEAYEPAVRLMERGRTALAALRDRGALRADADVDELVRVWTIVISGVVSQQLANAPTERFEDGRFTTRLPQVVEMYLRFYTP
jgi:AcrR family transcriptional regulator